MLVEIVNRTNITSHLIKYELEMIGKTLVDAVENDRWWFEFTMTHNQFDQFRSYALPLIRKTFKCNKAKAEHTFGWYWDNFGVRLKR